MTQILLITGPAGVGKSTLSWEVSAQLAWSGIEHAAIDTDELDRIYPRPAVSELEELRAGMTDISEANLASIWSNYRALGCDRLILSGVMVVLDEAQAWIGRAIPDAQFIMVRLLASTETLLNRLEKREVGSGKDQQRDRTLLQAARIASNGSAGVVELNTDERSPQDLASDLLKQISWLRAEGMDS